MFTRCAPTSYPRATAFANCSAQYFAPRAMPRKALGKGKSFAAAWQASGASPARIAAKLAVAYAALQAGQPLPWPRGFA